MTRDRPLVLVVDDEPANRALLEKLLKHHGYEVTQADDGVAALEAVEARAPDLVCLDVMMPRLDGLGVCRALREEPRHAGLPILLLTALNRPEDRVRGLEAGANDFLSKPFDEAEMAARVASLLRTKALQDRLADVLGRYVSESVAAEVMRDPFAVSLGGDRRYVTTMFADIRGYTTIAAEQPPEVTLELLNAYLSTVTDAIESQEGTVAELLGDGVFAIFGAPVAHDDDPRRAVRAALQVRDTVGELDVPALPGVRLQTGIGLTSGEVVAGNVGSERRMHYAVIGDVVNVAARLQTAAGPSQILIDEPTREALGDSIRVQDLGTLRLAGKSDWIRAFSVLGLLENDVTPADA